MADIADTASFSFITVPTGDFATGDTAADVAVFVVAVLDPDQDVPSTSDDAWLYA